MENLNFDLPDLATNTLSEGTSLVVPGWDTTSFVTDPDPLIINGTGTSYGNQHIPNLLGAQMFGLKYQKVLSKTFTTVPNNQYFEL